MKHVRLILVRHTESTMNLAGRYSGARNNPHLTLTGFIQADQVSIEIAKLGGIAAIYASDLLRTELVAVAIGMRCKRQVKLDQRLRETDVGDMSGLTKPESVKQFPDAKYRTKHPGYDFCDIGGESYDQVVERQLAVFREVLDEHGADSADDAPLVVIVGHGTSIRSVLCHLGHSPDDLHKQGEYQIITFSE